MKMLPVIAVAGVVLAGSVLLINSNGTNAVAEQGAGKPAAKAQAKGQKPRERGPARATPWFTGADADKDGKLSNQEFHTAHEKYFKAADADNDGAITPEEMRTHRDNERTKRRAAREQQQKPTQKPTQQQKP